MLKISFFVAAVVTVGFSNARADDCLGESMPADFVCGSDYELWPNDEEPDDISEALGELSEGQGLFLPIFLALVGC